MRPMTGESSGQNQPANWRPGQSGHTGAPLVLWNHSPVPQNVDRLNLGKGAARLTKKSLSEGLGQLSLGPGTELAALLNRTKAKEE